MYTYICIHVYILSASCVRWVPQCVWSVIVWHDSLSATWGTSNADRVTWFMSHDHTHEALNVCDADRVTWFITRMCSGAVTRARAVKMGVLVTNESRIESSLFLKNGGTPTDIQDTRIHTHKHTHTHTHSHTFTHAHTTHTHVMNESTQVSEKWQHFAHIRDTRTHTHAHTHVRTHTSVTNESRIE